MQTAALPAVGGLDYEARVHLGTVLLLPLLALVRPFAAGRRVAATSSARLGVLILAWSAFLAVSNRCAGALAGHVAPQLIIFRVPLDAVAAGTVLLAPLLGLAMALVQAPRIIRRPAQAGRGVLVAWACVACAAAGAAVTVLAFVPLAAHDQSERPMALLLTALAGWMWVIGSTVRGAAEDTPGPDLPAPRCEGCGYDLTHVAADGRCVECGAAASASLADNPRRAAVGSLVRTPWTWAANSYRIIARPGWFYRRLALRAAAAPVERFAHRTMLTVFALSALASVSVLSWAWLALGAPGTAGFVVRVGLLMGMLFALGGYAAHRLVAGAAGWWWLLTDALPDHRWGARVMCCEAACVWLVVGLAWVVMLAMPLGIDWEAHFEWVSRALPVYVPPVPLLLFGGCFALGCLWLLRLQGIARKIRWANA